MQQLAEAKPKKKLSLAELAALEWKLEQATNTLTKNADAKARLQALEDLKSVTDHRVVQPLARALKEDPDPKVRLQAATALGAVRTPEAKGVLIVASTGDPDSNVREAAKAAVGKFSRRIKPAALKIKSASFRKPSRVDGNAIKKTLGSPSGDARLWAIKQAASVNFSGREGLVKKHLWSDPSSRVRVKAGQILARIAKKRALRALIKAAGDGDPGVRFEIVRVLSTFDDPGALIAVQKMSTDDANETVRAEAKDLLEPSTRVGQRLLKRRIKMLRSANPADRIKALDELAKLTHWRAMVPMSCTLLSDKSMHVRTAAAKTLTNMHDTSVLTALRAAAVIEPDNGLKTKVRKLLGGMRRRVDQLIKQLQSKDPTDRLLAARAIGQAAYPPGLKPLVAASKDKQPKVRRVAVRGLRNFDAAKVADALKVATADSDAEVRGVVNRYFKQQGRLKGWRKFFRDKNRLVTKTMDKNATWRADAAIALGIIGAESAIGSLLRLLREDKDEKVRLAAAWGLVLMASPASEKALKKAAAKDKSQRVRLAARKYLVIGKVSVNDLLGQLRDESADVRRDAAEALSLRANSKVLHHLIRAAMCDPSADVRRTALRGLARIGNPLARNVIRTAQVRDPDRWVKRTAMMMYILAGGT